MLYRTALLCTLLLSVHAVSALGQEPRVEVIPEMMGRSVVLTAKLDRCLDVTLTLDCTLVNMTSSASLPMTIDSAGRKQFEVARLSVAESRKPFSYDFRLSFKLGGTLKLRPKPHAYSLPFRSGSYRLIQGPRGPTHQAGTENEEAIDWAMPIGTKVFPVRAGVVVALREDCPDNRAGDRPKTDYNFLVIRHDDGTYAEYQHLTTDGVLFKLGDRVTENDAVALSGNSGVSLVPHLHVVVFVNESGTKRRSLPISFK